MVAVTVVTAVSFSATVTVAPEVMLGRAATLTVTVPVLRSVTGAVRPVARYLLTLPNRTEPMDVCSVEPLPG